MRFILSTLFIFISLTSVCQIKYSLDTLTFDQIIMVDIEPGEAGDPYVYDKYGRENHDILKEVPLDKSTMKELNAKLNSRASYGKSYASCFEPEFGLIYMYQGRLVTQIIISLKCNRLLSKSIIPAQLPDNRGDGDITYYSLSGFSSGFRKYLNTLLIKYKFSNQFENNPDIDD